MKGYVPVEEVISILATDKTIPLRVTISNISRNCPVFLGDTIAAFKEALPELVRVQVLMVHSKPFT